MNSRVFVGTEQSSKIQARASQQHMNEKYDYSVNNKNNNFTVDPISHLFQKTKKVQKSCPKTSIIFITYQSQRQVRSVLLLLLWMRTITYFGFVVPSIKTKLQLTLKTQPMGVDKRRSTQQTCKRSHSGMYTPPVQNPGITIYLPHQRSERRLLCALCPGSHIVE